MLCQSHKYSIETRTLHLLKNLSIRVGSRTENTADRPFTKALNTFQSHKKSAGRIYSSHLFFSSLIKHRNLKMMPPEILKEEDNDDLSLSSQSMSDFGTSKTSAPSSSSRTGGNSESQPELARNEETRRLIRSSKALVLITILVATAACGAATYIFISRGEEAAFRGQVSENEGSICCIVKIFEGSL